MAIENSNNKRIVKNSVMLYIRMLLSIFVSLYTSRIILKTLGADDYGIYNVVGGVVAMFSFLNASMSGATSRFLTFALGKNDIQLQKNTFSSALLIHIFIAVLVLFFVETIGVWFLNHKLVIPMQRMTAAHIVLQCSIISMFFNVTQVPYNASIIAHEDMDVYAYVELLNVFLKLGIVFLLSIGPFDKLIFYAILMTLTSIIVAIVYRVYCLRHYIECKFFFVWDKSILKPLLSFSGWDILGNLSFIARTQGTSFIFNIIYGVLMNAACGIATTVQGIIQGFSTNIIQAFRPVIIKDYASGDIKSQQLHTESAIRIATILLSAVAVPLIVEADYVMKLWLGNVPDYAVVFCQILLLINYFSTASNCVIISIHATGKVKTMSFIGSLINFITLPLIYFTLKFNDNVPESSYLITLAMSAITFYSFLHYLKMIEPELKAFSIISVFNKSLLIGSVCLGVSYMLHCSLEQSFGRLLLIVVTNIIVEFTLSYIFLLTDTERSYISILISRIVKKQNNKTV